MRKKLLITLLPLLGAVVMVGSAYSAWVFTNSANINEDITGTVTVTPIAETLDFVWTGTTENFTLTLDQGGINNTATSVGISSSLDTNDEAFTFKLTKDSDLNLDDYYVTLDYSLTISAGGDYITLANGTEGKISNTAPIYLAENATAVQDKLSYKYSNNVWEFTVDATASDGKVFHYATGKKPTNANQYNSMSSYYTTEQSNRVTLSFTATINVIDKATA